MEPNKTEKNQWGIDLFLIAQYIDGAASHEESQKVEEWLSISADNRIEYARLKRIWELASLSSGMKTWNTAKRKEEFLKKIIESNPKESPAPLYEAKTKTLIIRDILKYAAAIVLMIGLTGIFITRFGNRDKDKFTTISAARGSKTEMVLPDGSRINLNAGSVVKYAANFNETNRNIYLEGEGYFEVARLNGKPFKVYAGDLVIKATGTAFNVKAYPEEKVIETTLVEGSVTVFEKSNMDNKIYMVPNDQVDYYRSDPTSDIANNFVIMKGINPEVNTSWINDQLIINNETLQNLAVKLERKYDIKINFEDQSIRELRYTGVLDNETIEQVLDVLKISSPLDYRIEKREIWLFHD